MTYKLAIFDFDGTLADSFPFFASVINQLAVQHKFKPIAPDQFEEFRSYTARQIMQQVGLPRWRLPFVARSFIGMMKERGSHITMFEGVSELLSLLHQQDMRIAIVTANSYGNFASVLGEENLKKIAYFECGASIFGKASKIKRILKKTAIASSHAIYIGDQTADLEAAREAKVAFGAVAWGYSSLELLESYEPEMTFQRMADIVQIVKTKNNEKLSG